MNCLDDSIVLISSNDTDNSRFGTGFIAYQDGDIAYIITCAHVVNDVGGENHVLTDGREACIIAIDDDNTPDLAVLKSDKLSGRMPLSLWLTRVTGSFFATVGFQSYHGK